MQFKPLSTRWWLTRLKPLPSERGGVRASRYRARRSAITGQTAEEIRPKLPGDGGAWLRTLRAGAREGHSGGCYTSCYRFCLKRFCLGNQRVRPRKLQKLLQIGNWCNRREAYTNQYLRCNLLLSYRF